VDRREVTWEFSYSLRRSKVIKCAGVPTYPSYLDEPALLREIWGIFLLGNGVSACVERGKKICAPLVFAILCGRVCAKFGLCRE